MREAAATKAARYLVEGRVILTGVGADRVAARIRGDGAVHQVTWRGDKWTCTCPALSDRCSHLLAVRRVVAVDLERPHNLPHLTGLEKEGGP